jgi:hypothetical protein
VGELPWAVGREAASRVTINCWYQRPCGAVGVRVQHTCERVLTARRVPILGWVRSSASTVRSAEEAIAEAEKHASRSEPVAELVAVVRAAVEQARAVEAARARVAAEAAAEAAEAARQQMEAELAALILSVRSDALRLRSDRRRVLQMQAQLGVPPAAPPAAHPDEEDQCVMCFDAPKDHVIIPCGHMCVCEGCATLLKQTAFPSCPLCRRAIQHTNIVFQS